MQGKSRMEHLLGCIPFDRLPEALQQADAEAKRAHAVCTQALTERGRVEAEWGRVDAEVKRTFTVWTRNLTEWEQVSYSHTAELEALHAALCPDCGGKGE